MKIILIFLNNCALCRISIFIFYKVFILHGSVKYVIIDKRIGLFIKKYSAKYRKRERGVK